MPGIDIAAAIVSVLALFVVGAIIVRKATPAERRPLLLAILLTLPMNALAFHAVRLPLDAWIRSFQLDLGVYGFLTTFYAPVTEELAKLWPLLLPLFHFSRSGIKPARLALALGLGFGIGEAWNLAYLIAKSPAMAALPWWQFGGFLGERLIVCFLHGVFALLPVVMLAQRGLGGFLLGLAGGMALHYFGNFPIYLAGLKAFGIAPAIWTQIIMLWLLLYVVLGALLLAKLWGDGATVANLLLGRHTCPGCKVEYDPPIFLAFNFGTKRYERCPACRKWHWVK